MNGNSRVNGRALPPLLALTLVGLLMTAGGSSASPVRPLAPVGCWEPAPGANPSCADVAGMGHPWEAVLSRDGRSLFVSGSADTLANFARDPRTGDLTFRQCFVGLDVAPTTCTQVPGMTAPSDLEATSDGRSLYLLGKGLLSFTRDPSTGDLTFSGCLQDVGEAGPSPGCTPVDAFGRPTDLAVSPDGRAVYVTGGDYPEEDWGAVGGPIREWLVSFRRDSRSGQLTLLHRQKGFGIPRSLAVSPDGRSVYGLASPDGLTGAGIVRFAVRRDGRLRLAWCRVRQTTKRSPCRRPPGMGFPVQDIALGPRARSLLVLSTGGLVRPNVRAVGLASFGLSRTGRLSFQGCIEDASGEFGPRCRRIHRLSLANPGALTISGNGPLTISGNGRWAYLLASRRPGNVPSSGSLLVLHRKARSGRLSFSQCLDSARRPGDRCASPSPFTLAPPSGPWRAAASYDGSFLYVPSGAPALLEFRAP
jgi:hypothetical protein